MKDLKLIISIIGQIIIFNIGVFLTVTLSKALFVTFIIILFGIICSALIYFIVNKLKGSVSLLAEKEYCDKESLLCPLNIISNEYNNNLIVNIDRNVAKTYRLYEKDEVYETELVGAWNNIWIFSENLSSEVNPRTEGVEPVVIANISCYNTKYTMFYIDSENDREKINDRKRKLTNSLPEDKQSSLSFETISVQGGYLGEQTLPLFCGSILFSKKSDDNDGDMPEFTEGYLSIRNKDKEDDNPIYYKMSQCMLKGYSAYFQEIYKHNQTLVEENKKQEGKK